MGAVVALLASCSAPKDITYFEDVTQGSVLNIPAPYALRVQPGDKLSIVVSTPDNRISFPLNLQIPGRVNSQYGDAEYRLGYTVDTDGTLDFPMLGRVQAAGLTQTEIAANIKKRLQDEGVVSDPIVLVDFLNLGVAVLGDVKHPGWYDLPRDHYTILEIIADAGDLNLTGMRTNVKLMRNTPAVGDQPSRETLYVVDLQDATSLCESPAFFVQPNDVIYVEPNTKQKRYSDNNSNVFNASFYISLGTLLTSIAALFVD